MECKLYGNDIGGGLRGPHRGVPDKHPERRDARTISEETSDSPCVFLEDSAELVQEGLVCNSFKGAKGGYTLAKPPQEITLRSY